MMRNLLISLIMLFVLSTPAFAGHVGCTPSHWTPSMGEPVDVSECHIGPVKWEAPMGDPELQKAAYHARHHIYHVVGDWAKKVKSWLFGWF